jgi:hypothetical protein
MKAQFWHLLLAVVIGQVIAAPSTNDTDVQWEAFKKNHRKSYKSKDEHNRKKAIFAKNLEKIRSHNGGKRKFSLAVNEFADIDHEEFISSRTGFGRRTDRQKHYHLSKLTGAAWEP